MGSELANTASLAARQACGGSEDAVEARVQCDGGQLLGDHVVVGEQIVLVDGEVFTDRWIGELEHVEIDGDSSDAASELERVDALVGEVAEELGPRCLLLVGGVPDAGFTLTGVPAWSSGRVGAGGEGMTGRALVPPAAGEAPSRGGCDRVGLAHT